MSRRRLSPSRGPRRGMVAVQVAITLTALMGVVAIAADGGIMLARRRHAQATADAAALAAAADLFQKYNTNAGVDGGTASTSATATAYSNGFLNDGVAANGTSNAANSSTVVVRLYPNNYSSGPKAGTAVPKGYAEVTVTYYQGRSFSRIFGSGTIPISARAVARGTWNAASDAGLILLNQSASKALMDTGNGDLVVSGGGIIVNSNAKDAIFDNGNGTITATYVKVSGGVKNSGNIHTSPGSLSTGATVGPDPLASLPVPSSGSLTSGQIVSQSTTGSGKNAQTTYTLSPGIWGSGGGTFPNFTSNDSILFQPGIYYLASGGFNFDGQSVQMSGTGGMMFYNASTSDGFNLSVSGTGTSTMTPPTSGIYQGISYFQNRSSTQGISLAGNGSSTLTISGTYYAPNGTLTLTGNGNASFGSQVIVNEMKLAGNGDVAISYSGNSVARSRSMSLVE